MLTALIKEIENQNPLTQEKVQETVIKLVQATAMYRKSTFFQASYGQTKSAHALFSAMKNDGLDTTLKISKIIGELTHKTAVEIKNLPNDKIGRLLEQQTTDTEVKSDKIWSASPGSQS